MSDLEPIVVERDEFDRDPKAWFDKASTEQVVLVMRAGKVSIAIGGSMAMPTPVCPSCGRGGA